MIFERAKHLLRGLNKDIALLQETYSSSESITHWKFQWQVKMFFFFFFFFFVYGTNHSREVLILFRGYLQIDMKNVR